MAIFVSARNGLRRLWGLLDATRRLVFNLCS